MSTEREQPAVGGVCLNCGADETAWDMELCERCNDMVVEERLDRARALKENGRLRTERLAREAAAKSERAPEADRTAFVAAPGCAALRATLARGIREARRTIRENKGPNGWAEMATFAMGWRAALVNLAETPLARKTVPHIAKLTHGSGETL